MKKVFNNIGVKVSIVTLITNFLLFIFKIIAGIIAHSHAMISDAVHSLSDVLSTVAVIFGLLMSNKKADKHHPYGHERIEPVFAIILSFLLLLTGVGIGYLGIINIIHKNVLTSPGILALFAALISIVVKEAMFHYTMHTAKKINSLSMKADAWHHRSDALSSIGSFIGILGARCGYPILDPLCSILICILIIKTAIFIFIDSITQMIDASCDEQTERKIRNTILENKDVIDIKDFKTRMFGNKIYIDVDIVLDGKISLKNANIIVEKIHDLLEIKYKLIKHCNIHAIPDK